MNITTEFNNATFIKLFNGTLTYSPQLTDPGKYTIEIVLIDNGNPPLKSVTYYQNITVVLDSNYIDTSKLPEFAQFAKSFKAYIKKVSIDGVMYIHFYSDWLYNNFSHNFTNIQMNVTYIPENRETSARLTSW